MLKIAPEHGCSGIAGRRRHYILNRARSWEQVRGRGRAGLGGQRCVFQVEPRVEGRASGRVRPPAGRYPGGRYETGRAGSAIVENGSPLLAARTPLADHLDLDGH
ncbi:hypothetical protein, partial [Micromonospora sp. NPDC048947]|uniref:hypothetical protein n=1 Tax=Micromonospora sp. NPDC048947 TaxID=3154826 RepID=UPI0033CCC523